MALIWLIIGNIIGLIEMYLIMYTQIKNIKPVEPEIREVIRIQEVVKTAVITNTIIKTNEIIRVVTNFVPVVKTVIQKEYVVREVQKEVVRKSEENTSAIQEVQMAPEKPHHCRIYRMINGKYVEDPKYMEGKMEY